MKCNTRDFGEVSYTEKEIINFVHPIFGFDQYKKYIILLDDQIKDSICWLQSIDNPEVCFIILEISSMYKNESFKSFLKEIGEEESHSVFGICVISEDIQKSTVNMRSPILINEKTQKAIQIILDGNYKLKQPLFESEG